jgi:hypothetical protein
MAITATDLIFRLTVKTGSAGDTTAGTPAGSLGGFTSTTAVSGTALNNIFDDITGAENAASTVDYRAVDILNAHASLTYQNAVVFVGAETAGGASVAIAVDPTGPVAKTSASQGLSIATETTAPAGPLTYTTPTTAAAGLSLGSLAASQIRRVWIRRTAAASAALDADGFTLSISGDTAA